MNKHDRPKLSKIHWHYIIIDEGHRIKNASCKLNADLKYYQSSHRLLLTGTPLQVFFFSPFEFSFLGALIAVYFGFSRVPFEFFCNIFNHMLVLFLGNDRVESFFRALLAGSCYVLRFFCALVSITYVFFICRTILKNYGHYLTSCYRTYSIHRRTSLNGLTSHFRVLEIARLMK